NAAEDAALVQHLRLAVGVGANIQYEAFIAVFLRDERKDGGPLDAFHRLDGIERTDENSARVAGADEDVAVAAFEVLQADLDAAVLLLGHGPGGGFPHVHDLRSVDDFHVRAGQFMHFEEWTNNFFLTYKDKRYTC